MIDATEGPFKSYGRQVYKLNPLNEPLWIATVQPCDIAVETADLESVARIMAAAPKMRQALKDVLAFWVTRAPPDEDAWTYEQARVALAACELKGDK